MISKSHISQDNHTTKTLCGITSDPFVAAYDEVTMRFLLNPLTCKKCRKAFEASSKKALEREY